MNSRFRRYILLLSFIAGIAVSIKAEDSRYQFMQLSIDNGLSNNRIKFFFQENNGFMWFATGHGLDRFDGTNFKIYRHDAFDPHSIPFTSVDYMYEDWEHQIWLRSINDFVLFDPSRDLFTKLSDYYKDTRIPLTGLETLKTDKEGKTWFVNSAKGLYCFDSKSGKSDSIIYVPESFGSKAGDYINGIEFDSKNQLWAVTHYCQILKIDPASKKVLETFNLYNENKSDNSVFNIYIDSEDDVWVYAGGQPFGLYWIQTGTGEIEHLTDASGSFRLSNSIVSSVVEEREGLIWVATDHGGINVIDKKKRQVLVLTNNRDDAYSLCQNSVTQVYRDSGGIIWAGTYKKGVSYYHPNLVQFEHYKYMPSEANSLPYDDVNCFVEDNIGNLWVGTNGGGLIYFDRKEKSWKTYRNKPDDPNSLTANVIVSLCLDRHNQLWIGTYFGGLDRFDGKVFHHHKHDITNPGSLSDDRVWEIFEDSHRNLWVGTLAGGLNLYDRDKDIFYHYRMGDVNSVGSDFITSMAEDSEGNLWIGTSEGIDRFNLDTRRFYHFAAQPGVEGKLSDKNVMDLQEDSRGLLWIATYEGLNVYDKRSDKFRVFTEKDGLPDNNIKTLQEDQEGNIWISTTHGISRIRVQENLSLDNLKIEVWNFDQVDGLQGREFNEKAAYRTKAGELIFGGGNGFNLFIPERIMNEEREKPVILTGLKVFNQEVKVGEKVNNRVLLENTLNRQSKIVLRHSENVFSIGFAALNFFHPEKNSFEYKLEGFNQEWLKADQKNNEATFTNLNAGDYAFRVRVSSDGVNWNELASPLKITVLPPFWKSRWAILLYILALGAALALARRMIMERQRLKFEAEQEHREAQRIQQLDNLKTKFFTNISHEFRTPLSLIMAPLEKLILKTEEQKSRNQLIFIHRQSRRLLMMVNQLLDFRKMEFQKIEAKRTFGELTTFIRDLGNSFEDMAANKKIDFQLQVGGDSFYTWFDQDKVYKIISNLISNAFKFTPESGKISLSAGLRQESFQLHGKTHVWLEVTVSDSGIGIPAEKQSKIFDRFYQDDVPHSIVNQGSGIGLSMVTEYVNILDGSVKVDSVVGKGSTFTVLLPVQLLTKEEVDVLLESQEARDEMKFFAEDASTAMKELPFDQSKKTILLVEDNDDFRFYLIDNLREIYNIVEARNGKEGWERCLKYLPDLVVSDVMMPVMAGTDLCRKIKGDGRTSHMPVILLTAKVETEDTLEGLESGADDYISKPFDFRILESRIENLINSREQLRLTYQTMIGINPEKIEVTSLDEKFIKKVLEVVGENISNADFSVEDLSREVGMSRVSLYKKLLSLTKKSPVEFIRIIRLKRAADLLENSQFSVSEIAYQVGFNSPRYFTRYFKEYYHELPSEYITKKRKLRTDFQDEI